jgi:hypothetical protein
MVSKALRFSFLALACVIFASVGRADTIPVVNGDFDSVPSSGLTDGCGFGCSYDVGAIFGWNQTGAPNAGQFEPGTTMGMFNYFPGGNTTMAFSNGATIWQTVGATVESGVTYTLQVMLGARTDEQFDGSAELLIGGSTVVPCMGTGPASGNWETCTATFTGNAADAGDTMTIELLSSGDQGDFSNVSLTDSLPDPTPEPGSLALLAAALLGMAVFARKRLAQNF